MYWRYNQTFTYFPLSWFIDIFCDRVLFDIFVRYEIDAFDVYSTRVYWLHVIIDAGYRHIKSKLFRSVYEAAQKETEKSQTIGLSCWIKYIDYLNSSCASVVHIVIKMPETCNVLHVIHSCTFLINVEIAYILPMIYLLL